MSKIRKYAQILRAPRNDIFLKKVAGKGMTIDMATRWGSTKISSDSFLNHKDDKDKNRFANFEAINSVLKQLKEKEKSTKKKDKLKGMIFSKEDMNGAPSTL